jgi:hypothetical protein
VADYLREVKLLALQEITSKLGDHIKPDHVQWCLTLPAIWHDHAKQVMKAASDQASLVGVARGCNSYELLIALEPGAAALYRNKQLEPIMGGIAAG